ncbi:transporter substrate-binding domain-containing protein [uncultured Kocuria sp.]|uniref:transporter substrate-binding domain-containing protein n=1 Tax=uncultured Kocuria sp. TaxID=259305 RepID=UPI00261D9950|nr:transporter substrate-binding domain-containing protein [uncultured Kocuria sp.]
MNTGESNCPGEERGPLARSMAPASVRSALAPTGVLRVVINLGNPVLAQGTAKAPRGVTVGIAHQLARWLGAPLQIASVLAARDAYRAITAGKVDLCFLAIEPAREDGVVFTAPYALIEGIYIARANAGFNTAHEVDAPGVRIGVRTGSAYDLYLTRTVAAAEIVRGPEVPEVFEDEDLPVCAGIRQPLTEYATAQGHYVLEPPFMEIRQAVGMRRGLPAEIVGAVAAQVELLKSSGFVHRELRRSGAQATVAPPAR